MVPFHDVRTAGTLLRRCCGRQIHLCSRPKTIDLLESAMLGWLAVAAGSISTFGPDSDSCMEAIRQARALGREVHWPDSDVILYTGDTFHFKVVAFVRRGECDLITTSANWTEDHLQHDVVNRDSWQHELITSERFFAAYWGRVHPAQRARLVNGRWQA